MKTITFKRRQLITAGKKIMKYNRACNASNTNIWVQAIRYGCRHGNGLT